MSWWVDFPCTSCVRRAFILCWHNRDNKHLLNDRNIKGQDDFSAYVGKVEGKKVGGTVTLPKLLKRKCDNARKY